jgi:nucleotide-binding universal stress UspA family protein
VVREAACQTLVIPQIADLRPTTFDRILCAVDLSPSSEATIEAALRLRERRDRQVTLLHVVNGPESGEPSHYPWLGSHEYYRGMGATALEQLQSLIPPPERGLVLARVAVGNPVAEIVRVAEKTNAQLLVIGGRPRNSIGRRLFGRTGQLIREASCPVLAVPKPTQATADQPEGRSKVAA